MQSTTISLNTLGAEIKMKRRDRGLRAVAEEIGVSSATLSRVESGKQPDLDTFSKICKWLEVDPSEVLGFDGGQNPTFTTAQFRASRELQPKTAGHLAELILAVEKHLSELSPA